MTIHGGAGAARPPELVHSSDAVAVGVAAEAEPEMARHNELSQRADRIRDRLALTLGELDRRRHELVNKLDVPKLKAALARNRTSIEFLAGVAAGVALTGTVVAVVRSIERRQHPNLERWRALVRAWEHPERLAR